jgi:hypothetical protein
MKFRKKVTNIIINIIHCIQRQGAAASYLGGLPKLLPIGALHFDIPPTIRSRRKPRGSYQKEEALFVIADSSANSELWQTSYREQILRQMIVFRA